MEYQNNPYYQKFIAQMQTIVEQGEFVFVGKKENYFCYLVKANNCLNEDILFTSYQPLKTNLEDLSFKIQDNFMEWYHLQNDEWTLQYLYYLQLRDYIFDKTTRKMRNLEDEFHIPIVTRDCIANEECKIKWNELWANFHQLNAIFGDKNKLNPFQKESRFKRK